MREVDRLTTERLGISQLQLMENAAHCLLEVFKERYAPLQGQSVSLICGKGNNGGDGLALARLLHDAGAEARVYLFAFASELRDLTRINYESLRDRKPTRLLEVHSRSDWDRLLPEIRESHIVVDALLGTGISKPLEGLLLHVVESVNGLNLPTVAVDVPSGLLSDEIAAVVPCIRAHLTVTFTAPKIGMLLGPNTMAVGEMIVASIGSPPELVEQVGSSLSLATRTLLEPFQRPRAPFSHKGDFGKVLIVAGSRGKSGAALLAGWAALRAGAGLVTLATPFHIQDVVMSAAVPELMTEGLPDTEEGMLVSAAGRKIAQLLENFDVLAIGPGLGTSVETIAAIHEAIERSPVPIVADADAINALAASLESWKTGSSLILTPHVGEMARLVKKIPEEVFADRIALVSQFATQHGCELVLKGFRTLVSDPSGDIWVNPTGNPGMATAGSGDVLTGIIAAFVARNLRRPTASLHDAVAAAVYLHGEAGDCAMSQMGQESLMAGDIVDFLPEVLTRRP